MKSPARLLVLALVVACSRNPPPPPPPAVPEPVPAQVGVVADAGVVPVYRTADTSAPVDPAIAGSGRKLFEPTDPPMRLRLVESTVTSRGNVVSTYAPRAD